LPNQSIKLTNSSQNATSYSWSFKDGTPSTSTDKNPTVAYPSPGEYTITLTAKNANCQDVEEKKNVVTIGNPISILDDFEINEGHFNSFPTYSGITNGISSSSTQKRITSTALAGSGSLEVKMLDNTSSSADWIVRLLSGTGRPSDNTPIASKGTINFYMKTSTANKGAAVQVWFDDNDGLEASPFVSIANDGKWHLYSFDLEDFGGTTITTGNGKLDASEVTLDAIVLAQPNTSSTWTAYIDHVAHDISESGTYLEELEGEALSNDFINEELSEIRIHPNPSKGTFRINLNNAEVQGFDVNIFNTSGSLVHSTQAFSNQFDVDVQDLPDGMYFVNVRNNDFNKTISIMIAK
jgi:PKD repeat protein